MLTTTAATLVSERYRQRVRVPLDAHAAAAAVRLGGRLLLLVPLRRLRALAGGSSSASGKAHDDGFRVRVGRFHEALRRSEAGRRPAEGREQRAHFHQNFL